MGANLTSAANLPPAIGATPEAKGKLPPILFIRLDKLLALPEEPRLGISSAQRASLGFGAKKNITDPKVKETLVQDWKNLSMCVGEEHFPATDFLVELGDIQMGTSVVGFVSHCWLRGWSGAPGYQDRPHPDDAQHNKHKLTKEALTKLQLYQFSGCTECYVWIDYCCINQDANPAAELKQLDLIIKSCDFLLTPIQDDKDGSWDLPATISSYFDAYKAEAWQKYLTRGWCLVEMMYAANIPLKDNAASESRLAMMAGPGLRNGLNRGYRTQFLYGTRESRLNLTPIGLPPLHNSFFTQYNPIAFGDVSSPADRAKIEELVSLLQPYIDSHTVEEGYDGDLDSNGVKNGLGTYTYANGDVYVGEWKDNFKNGHGKLVLANGDVYEGEYRDNAKSGLGKYMSASGTEYDGEWKDNVKNGHGRYLSANGDVYEGEYKDGVKYGHGKFMYASGIEYDGEWKDNVKNGHGRYLSANGCVFEGEYQDGVKSGHGKSMFPNGDMYEGEYKDGVKHGHGKFMYASGGRVEVYEGGFKDDCRNGYGKLVWNDGAVYEGEWKDGVFMGDGRLT